MVTPLEAQDQRVHIHATRAPSCASSSPGPSCLGARNSACPHKFHLGSLPTRYSAEPLHIELIRATSTQSARSHTNTAMSRNIVLASAPFRKCKRMDYLFMLRLRFSIL